MAIENRRTSAIAAVLSEHLHAPALGLDALVVGCGAGVEAAVLAQDLGLRVVGIDINEKFDSVAQSLVTLRKGDATALDFESESFDIVFSYHALEHIPEYHLALNEMRRVLRQGGLYCIGTPNRARLVGYVGGGSSLRQKVSWNLADWSARAKGEFRNECGAHAGYTSEELRSHLLGHFSSATEVTTDYYRRLYAGHAHTLGIVVSLGVGRYVFPSIYFVGER